MFSSALTGCAFLFGILILYSGDLDALPLFLVVGYLAIIVGALRSIHVLKDPLAPLILLLGIGIIRFGIPGILLLFGADPGKDLFDKMELRSQDWQMGHVLSLVGLLGVSLGWSLAPSRLAGNPTLKYRLTNGACVTALMGFLCGFAALFLFVASNASIADAFQEGTFRNTTIQSGTGKYFFLSFIMSSSAVLLSGYLLTRTNRPRWFCLLPVALAMLAFWMLGGRARAISPLMSGLFLVWYVGRAQRGPSSPGLKRFALWAVVGFPFLLWFAYLGHIYRDGGGTQAIIESVSIAGFWEYIQWGAFIELAQLHAMAIATKVEPGVLNGVTFYALTWPLSHLLDLPGRSVGVYLAEQVVTFGANRWGFHSSLIGDAYVNFGIVGLSAVMLLTGLLLKLLYVRFRRGSVHSVFYALAVIYATRVFFESIEKWGELVMVVASAWLLKRIGEALLDRNSRGTRTERSVSVIGKGDPAGTPARYPSRSATAGGHEAAAGADGLQRGVS